MLGQFWYRDNASDDDVVVHLRWVDGEPMGVVRAPQDTLFELALHEVALPPSEEYIRLPFALSYGLLVACYAKLKLTISGDQSVWPEQWGNLLDAQFRDFRIAAPIKRTV